jgi:hypothetical protein
MNETSEHVEYFQMAGLTTFVAPSFPSKSVEIQLRVPEKPQHPPQPQHSLYRVWRLLRVWRLFRMLKDTASKPLRSRLGETLWCN